MTEYGDIDKVLGLIGGGTKQAAYKWLSANGVSARYDLDAVRKLVKDKPGTNTPVGVFNDSMKVIAQWSILPTRCGTCGFVPANRSREWRDMTRWVDEPANASNTRRAAERGGGVLFFHAPCGTWTGMSRQAIMKRAGDAAGRG